MDSEFNNEDGAYNFGTGKKGSFLLSKYCRFLNNNTKPKIEILHRK
jgi:hypothetical protein